MCCIFHLAMLKWSSDVPCRATHSEKSDFLLLSHCCWFQKMLTRSKNAFFTFSTNIVFHKRLWYLCCFMACSQASNTVCCAYILCFRFFFFTFPLTKGPYVRDAHAKEEETFCNNVSFCLEGLKKNLWLMRWESGMARPNATHIDLYHPYFLYIWYPRPPSAC